MYGTEQFTEAVTTWLSLERPHTSLPDLAVMKQDLQLPVELSLHGRKTAGHSNKARFLTLHGLAHEGPDSLLLLAKATNVWSKLIAGFVIKPRYLTANSQEAFWNEIMTHPSDLSYEQHVQVSGNMSQFTGTQEAFVELFTAAEISTANAMQTLHKAALLNDTSSAVMPAFIDSQVHLYGLAVACLHTQLTKAEGNYERVGIMEPGKDAESDRVISITELVAL